MTESPRSRHGSRGQALAEAAIAVALLVPIVAGLVDVGFAFFRTNMIVNAARDGARWGATLDKDFRVPETGCFSGNEVKDHTDDLLEQFGFTRTSAVSQACNAGVPTVTVTVTGDLEMIFGLMSPSFEVQRSVTFEDEVGRCGC